MRVAIGLVVFGGALLFVPARAEDAATPVPKLVQIELDDHMVGGIVGRGPGWTKVGIGKSGREKAFTVYVTRDNGRRDGSEKPVQGRLTEAETAALWNEVKDVFELPQPDPPGCQDIYGLQTMLHVLVQDEGKPREWLHSYPSGCMPGGGSRTQPTPEQIERFRALIARIQAVAGESVPPAPEEKGGGKGEGNGK